MTLGYVRALLVVLALVFIVALSALIFVLYTTTGSLYITLLAVLGAVIGALGITGGTYLLVGRPKR